jgi:hypothetical protein
VDRDGSAQRLDAVGEPDEPRAAGRVGAADAVVANPQVQAAVACMDGDMGEGGVGVLGGVAERLRDDIVGGGLDRFW